MFPRKTLAVEISRDAKLTENRFSFVPTVMIIIPWVNYTAFRKASASRHHEDIIKGPPENPRSSRHYGTEGFKGGPQ